MLVLPLGLGTKLRRWPIATAALGCVWVAVFALYDNHGDAWRGSRTFAEYQSPTPLSRASAAAPATCEGPLASCARQATVAMSYATEEALAYQEEFARHAQAKLRQTTRTVLSPRFWEEKLGEPAPDRRPTPLIAPAAATPSRADFRHLLLSPLRHGGPIHLFVNFMLFLVFGAYVEQRGNRFAFAALTAAAALTTMVVGGSLFGPAGAVGLGASVCTSVVLGMFVSFFSAQKLRIWVWLPWTSLRGMIFAIDVRHAVPMLIAFGGVAGALDLLHLNVGSAQVAYAVHFIGILVGAGLAMVARRLRPLPHPFISSAELGDLRGLTRVADLSALLVRAEEMARVNPDNYLALEIGCAGALRWLDRREARFKTSLTQMARGFVERHLPTALSMRVRAGGGRTAHALISLMPMDLPMLQVVPRLGQSTTLAIADAALSAGDFLTAMRLYDLYIERFPEAPKTGAVEATTASVLAALAPVDGNLRLLSRFLVFHKASTLAPRISTWIRNVRVMEAR
jgi:membrane associated rhomboid family serine protease